MHSEQTKQKMREAAKVRWPSKLKKYGISEEQYRSEIRNGNKWCVGHKAFHPRQEFTHPEKSGPCRKYITEKSAKRYWSLSDDQRKEISRKSMLLENPERRKKRWLWHTYKITPERYQSILEAQYGKCAICQRPVRNKKLAVDHNHACCPGKRSCGNCVRGLLCSPCNRRLGLVEGGWFSNAQAYLQKYHQNSALEEK